VVCSKCGASFWVGRGKGGRPRTRCDACRSNHARIDSKKWRELRRRILAPGVACVYCGAPAVEVDHIVPLSLGGDPYAMENLAPACKRCNASKGGRYGALAKREQPRVTKLQW
jgi:5-methylcytosine-specific restriction endonuclease McrA